MTEPCVAKEHIEDIKDKVSNIDKTLAVQAVTLEKLTDSVVEHVKRSELSELRLDEVEKITFLLSKSIRFAMWAIPIIVTAIPIILKLLKVM
jgi:uncharacterized coiled-coil protein SlyX